MKNPTEFQSLIRLKEGLVQIKGKVYNKIPMISKIKDTIKLPYLFYLFVLLISIIVVIAILIHIDINIFCSASKESTLYLLSAMAQALATILAIVLGFSFVAIQLSTQIANTRVLDLYLKSKAFWTILVVYGFSISYDLLLLRIIQKGNVTILVNLINISIFLTIISFISLFPYAHYTIQRLKPEKIIQGIIEIRSDDIELLKRDTILPIADIMNKSIITDDSHTLKVGLDELVKLNLEIIKSEKNSAYKFEILKYYSRKIFRLIDTAFSNNQEDSILEITDSLRNIGISSIKMRWIEVPSDYEAEMKNDETIKSGISLPDKTDNYDKITSEIENILTYIYIKSIERKWSKATRSSLNAKGDLLVTSHEELILYPIWEKYQILNDFMQLSEDEKIFSIEYFIETIRNILIELIDKEINFDHQHYDKVIKDILSNSLQIVDEKNCYKVRQIIDYIIDIGIEAANKNHGFKDIVKDYFKIIAASEICYSDPIFTIGNKGLGFASMSKKTETLWICSVLKELGDVYLLKDMDKSLSNIFDFLEGIDGNFRNKESNDVLEVTRKIIEIIEEFGYKSIDHELEMSIKGTLSSLIQIGMMNDNIDLKNRLCEMLKNMQGKLENKDYFKSVLKIFENKQEYELGKFHEFNEFCGFDDVKTS